MTLNTKLANAYLERALRSPRARAHILNTIADAEDNGEAQIFDWALARVNDPKLQKMIVRHREDEIRHGRLFSAARDRVGVDPGPVPQDQKLLERIDAALGGFLTRPLTGDRDVLEAYLILQVIEERALAQFAVMEPLFRKVDPATADIFVEVAKDEERHLKYCEAISRRYAASEEERQQRLAELRTIEAECFRDNSEATVRYLNERGMMPSRLDGIFVLASRVGRLFDARPYTAFAVA